MPEFFPRGYLLPPEVEGEEGWRRKIRVPSCTALRRAVSNLYRLDDFDTEEIGSGFFSDVFKVTHKGTGKVMVLKMNKNHSNRSNVLKEVQLLNKLKHKNILRFEAACVHEGQLHALTEFVNGGSLEQLIQRKEEELPWSVRMSLALDTAKGLAYLHSRGYFHRDLTSKNVLVKINSDDSLTAVLGDFGLAAKIPNPSIKEFRLPQVGSPYWMSPECLRGQFYDELADSFSYGIILCELIGRCDADPDVLPRTENFGVDYIAFSEMCPTCPPDFLKLAFNCVRIEPSSRPSSRTLAVELEKLLDAQRKLENRTVVIQLRKVGHKRSLSEEEVIRRSPSEKARIHVKLSVKCIGKEMSLRDPHYRPSLTTQNPFATLPKLREGKKIIGSSRDLFSSCFELPSPARAPTPTTVSTYGYSLLDCRTVQSLPPSPTPSFEEEEEEVTSNPLSRCFDDHLFQGRVQLLRKIYSGGWVTQDDSAVELSEPCSMTKMKYSATSFPLRRRGSCESGFFSSLGTEDCFLDTSRSVGSSLLTVSDLEEDLRAASLFLTNGINVNNKRASSIFTDSTDDDLSSLTDERSTCLDRTYEKDIRDIVEYFEQTCQVDLRRRRRHPSEVVRLPRSAKIDSLIKRVVEKESRDRIMLRKSPQQQVCEGIVRSKLRLFDPVKKQTRRSRINFDQKGFVKSRMALFDQPPTSNLIQAKVKMLKSSGVDSGSTQP